MRPARTFTYDVALTYEGGRASVLDAAGRPPIPAAPPEDFPYGDGSRWSPEHLFLASLSSCTLLAFLAHAANAELDVRAYTADVRGTITRRTGDGRYAFTAVHLVPRVVVGPGQAEAARALTGKAERDCFVTASTTAAVTVEWDVAEA